MSGENREGQFKRGYEQSSDERQVREDESMWETSIELLVVANPDPNPYIVLSDGNRSIVRRHTHRPGPSIKAQPFQMQAGVCWVLSKLFIGLTGGSFYGRRQLAIQLPEMRCCSRDHDRRSKSASWISGKISGLRRCSDSIWSKSAVNAGRG